MIPIRPVLQKWCCGSLHVFVREEQRVHQKSKQTLLVALACCIFLSGCRSARNEQFTPQADQARSALAAVMEQWKAGTPPTSIEGRPSVSISDTQRKQGQRLLEYEILGELPIDVGYRYQVKLKLDNPAAEEKAQYIVVGIDPLWVFRQEDYDMLSHWDHPMPAATSGAAPEAATP